MGTGIGLAFAAVVLVAMTVVFIGLYVRYRGKRIVTCPETNLPVSTEINPALAACTWLATQPRFVVTACSRWPEHAGCAQACALQIEASPEETLVRNIVTRWYAERNCVYCAKPIAAIGGLVSPALLTSDGQLCEWADVAADDLPRFLASSVAVCATCELAEDFRRRFPERVSDRGVTPLRKSIAIEPHRTAGAESPSAVY
jgi:hypothetical protein